MDSHRIIHRDESLIFVIVMSLIFYCQQHLFIISSIKICFIYLNNILKKYKRKNQHSRFDTKIMVACDHAAIMSPFKAGVR